MRRRTIYWWNFKRFVFTTWYWFAVLFVLMAVSASILELLGIPTSIGGFVGLALIIYFFWKLSRSLRDKFPYTEEEIREEKYGGSDSRGGGAAAYCPHCQSSRMPDNIDENHNCKMCGGPVQVGESTPRYQEWWWDDEDW